MKDSPSQEQLEAVRPLTALNILIIEDNPMDLQVLKYLIEARFHQDSQILEAYSLAAGINILSKAVTDCVILDLGLPDSVGVNTFKGVKEQFPNVPIIVMTNNDDRAQALEMIDAGAADFLIKSFSDEEDIFRRIMFAVTKHRQTIRVPKERAGVFQRLEKAQKSIISAQRRNSRSELQIASADTTHAVADISRHLFAEIHQMSSQQAAQGARQQQLLETVGNLNKVLLQGTNTRPSMRSHLDLVDHRVSSLEEHLSSMRDSVSEDIKKLEGGVTDEIKDLRKATEAADITQRQEALTLEQAKISNRTKVILAVISLLGLIASSAVTYLVAKSTGAAAPAVSTSEPKATSPATSK